MAKVTRGLTVEITPLSKGKCAIVFKDRTTQSVPGGRETVTVKKADSFTNAAVPDALKERFKEFARNVTTYDDVDLFAQKGKGAPRLDGRDDEEEE